jgi:hypothetical protein
VSSAANAMPSSSRRILRLAYWLPVVYFFNAEVGTLARVSGRSVSALAARIRTQRSGSSMAPTLNPDDNGLLLDYVLVDRTPMARRALRSGDVVMLWCAGGRLMLVAAPSGLR